MRLEPGSIIGFSFKTCSPGELLRQVGSDLDQIDLKIDASGRLLLSVNSGDLRVNKVTGTDLLDGAWHTVKMVVSASDLTLSVSVRGGESISETVADMEDVLTTFSASSQLRVGAGLVGCIREGPGVRFTKPGVAVFSDSVIWGEENCLLPERCQGKT